VAQGSASRNRLVGAEQPGNRHHLPEGLRGLGVALLLIAALRDLELRVGREGAVGVLLDQLGEDLGAVGALPEPVERQLGAAGGLARHRCVRVARDRLRELLQRGGVPPGVVLALGQAERGQRGGIARGEVLEEAHVAALGAFVLLRLEVEIAGAPRSPRATEALSLTIAFPLIDRSP
jgi:hypothetical protein